jgi:hypothetical protein
MSRALPTRRQLEQLARPLVIGPHDLTVARLAAAIERERRVGSSLPDGMPASSLGGSGGGTGPTIVVDGERVPVTSVEAAVFARANPQRDKEADAVRDALRALEDAVEALRRLRHRLDLVDAVRSDDDLTPEPGCWAMARVDVWEPIHRKTFHGGEERALGRFAYDFLRRTGRLPSLPECKAHAEGRRIHLDARSKKKRR